jgi:hypothetical protein
MGLNNALQSANNLVARTGRGENKGLREGVGARNV